MEQYTPGNMQNHNQKFFLSSNLFTKCGPHIMHTQDHTAPALYKLNGRFQYSSTCLNTWPYKIFYFNLFLRSWLTCQYVGTVHYLKYPNQLFAEQTSRFRPGTVKMP